MWYAECLKNSYAPQEVPLGYNAADRTFCDAIKFSVADFRELTQKILGHASDVKIVSPPELKNLIKKEIEKMTKIYQDYKTV